MNKRGKWIAFLGLAVVIAIIVVAAPNLPQPAPSAGDGAQPSWQQVTTFTERTGSIEEFVITTDTFTVTGSKFRLTWSAWADPEWHEECVLITESDCPAHFNFHVYAGETQLRVESFSGEFTDFRSGETIVFESGSFYLEVGGDLLEEWGIQVHEWR